MDYTKYHFSVSEALRFGCLSAAAGVFVQWLCYRDWRAFPVAVITAWILMRSRRKALCEKRRELLQEHFREALQVIYASLCAGYSLENAVKAAADDVGRMYGDDDVMAAELAGICRGMSVRIPVERLFYELGERSKDEDIQSFGEVLMIAKRTGGNMDRAIKSCYRTLCERIDMKSEIRSITSAKRFEQRIMSILPACIILYMSVSFGGFMDPLYGNAFGAAVMTCALAVYACAAALGEKMVQIKI